jgi:hypothetical protein
VVTPRTGRPRGRPRKSLLDDPDRYAIALMLGFQTVYRVSEFKASVLAVALTEGEERQEGEWVRPAI